MGKTQIDMTAAEDEAMAQGADPEGDAIDEEDGAHAPGSADAVIAEDGARDDDVIDEDVDPADRLPRDAAVQADGSVKLPVLNPVGLRTRKGGKERTRRFEELHMHRLSGKDMRMIQSAASEAMIPTALACSMRINQAVANGLYDRLDAADITRAGQVLNHFLASGKTGGTRGSA